LAEADWLRVDLAKGRSCTQAAREKGSVRVWESTGKWRPPVREVIDDAGAVSDEYPPSLSPTPSAPGPKKASLPHCPQRERGRHRAVAAGHWCNRSIPAREGETTVSFAEPAAVSLADLAAVTLAELIAVSFGELTTVR
jgi:hypothetical protein